MEATAIKNQTTDEPTDEKTTTQSGEAKHTSLLAPDHMAFLFGDAVMKNLTGGGEFVRAIFAAKGWLKKLVMHESESERAGLRKQISDLRWDPKAHRALCMRLFNEASTRGDSSERIAKIQEALDRVQELQLKTRPKKPRAVAQSDVPITSDRTWLTKERIEVMIQASNCLGDTYAALRQRITEAFHRADPNRCEAFLRHLENACEARRRLMELLAAPEPIAPAPKAKVRVKPVRTSPSPSCRTGAERYRAKWGQPSAKTTPEGIVLH